MPGALFEYNDMKVIVVCAVGTAVLVIAGKLAASESATGATKQASAEEVASEVTFSEVSRGRIVRDRRQVKERQSPDKGEQSQTATDET